MRQWFLRFSGSIRAAATLFWAVLALRFAFASLGHAAADEEGGGPAPIFSTLRANRADELLPAPTASASASKKRPKVLHVAVAVSVGPPRSEVFMNGVRLGHSPFVGQASCEKGSKVKFELLPPNGPPLQYFRRCAGDTLRLVE